MSELLERWRWTIVALLTVPLLIGTGIVIEGAIDSPGTLVIESGDLPSSDIKVYVTGAIQNPGVYELPEGKRWIDAVEAAGGATSEANLTAINLSRRAQDEDHIIVPAIGDGTAVAASASQPLVNINAANQSELEELPGIGEVRAQSIIQSRTVDGPFGVIDDLISRELIPGSVFEDIAPLISVY